MPQKPPDFKRFADLFLRTLPGLGVMGLILSARMLGLLEPLELFAFDLLLRLRPHSPTSDRITVVKIDEADVERLNGYPISQEAVAAAVEQVQQYEPAVIGVNILSDLLEEGTSTPLVAQFQNSPTLIAAEKVLLPQVAPPK